MSSCEGITEAKERVGTRRAAIANGLVTNIGELHASIYVVMYDPESEQRFVDILHRRRDSYGNVRYESQIKLPYGASDSTVRDTVRRAQEIFKHRGIVFVFDGISEAELIRDYTPRKINKGRFRIYRHDVGLVDYYTERSITDTVVPVESKPIPLPHTSVLI